jgi:Zn-dependent protease with chaperone function
MQDFFESQEKARRKTRLLVLLFVVAVALIVLSVYTVISFLIYFSKLFESSFIPVKFTFWDPGLFTAVSLITVLIIALGSIHKMREVGSGGAVAEMLGGRLLQRNTRDLHEQRLLNVVEEMAIASGVQVPDVYVLDGERGINAFAAGFGVDDAVVCFTKGALRLLKRDELQGVTAHEFSHILNSDTLINIRLMGLLHGILLIALIGEGLLRAMRHTRGRSSLPGFMLGGSLYAIGYIGVLLGKLIKSAVLRQREYLADSSAVQFTRNPPGLAGALKKIGGLSRGSRLLHHKAPVARHMYFCDSSSPGLFDWMETHPPLEERILKLEPGFDGTFPKVKPLVPSTDIPPGLSKVEVPKADAVPLKAIAPAVSGAAVLAMLETAGAPMNEHAKLARQMIEELPDPVLEAAHEPSSASALVYALLLDKDEVVRSHQLAVIREREMPAVIEDTMRLAACLPYIKPRTRLPLMDMVLPSLRMLSEEQYAAFRANVDSLIAADKKMSFFEFLLSYVVMKKLEARFSKPNKRIAQIYSIRGLVKEASVVLTLMARLGQTDEDEAVSAFGRGTGVLKRRGADFGFLPAEECTLKELKAALDRLAVSSPPVKRSVLAACQECISHSGEAKVMEVELFRAVCEALGCPVPPWVSASSNA